MDFPLSYDSILRLEPEGGSQLVCLAIGDSGCRHELWWVQVAHYQEVYDLLVYVENFLGVGHPHGFKPEELKNTRIWRLPQTGDPALVDLVYKIQGHAYHYTVNAGLACLFGSDPAASVHETATQVGDRLLAKYREPNAVTWF